MKKALLLLAALLIPATAAPAQQKKPEPLVEKVKRAIDKGVSHLRSTQSPGGSWDDDKTGLQYPGGGTSLALLALLNSGVPVNDPMIQKGLTNLRGLGYPPTYV